MMPYKHKLTVAAVSSIESQFYKKKRAEHMETMTLSTFST